MRTLSIALLLLTACASATTSSQPLDKVSAVEQVRAAETAFAKAFADRDKTRFFTMVDDDANFLGRNRTLHGKSEVVEVWGKMLEAPEAEFSWSPDRVEVNGDGTIGLSSGPVLDRSGRQISTFSSIWQRQRDGSWKVIFDGPGCPRAQQ